MCFLFHENKSLPVCLATPLTPRLCRRSSFNFFLRRVFYSVLQPIQQTDDVNNINGFNVDRVLGDPFLRTFYTSYNVADKTVGVAQATNSRTSSECDADASIGSAPANSGGGDGDEIGGPSVGGDVGGESMSVVAVGVVAGLATMAMISCGVVVFAVRQRFSKAGGAYRPAVNDIDGGGGGGGSGFEMSSGGNESVRHGGFEREGDFLQASPRPGVSSSGSGGRGAKRGVFGGLFGPPPTRAGFAAFENAD